MHPEPAPSCLTRLGSARTPPRGRSHECATLLKFLESAQAVRASLRRTLAEQGLTEFGFEVLSAMKSLGGPGRVPLSPSVIADTCGLLRATLTDVLARLEAAGLIARHRNAADRRQLLAVLTDRGHRVCSRATEQYMNTIRALMSGMGPKTRSVFDRSLDNIQSAARPRHSLSS